MKFFEELEKIQKQNNSLVCVGLDIDLAKVPKFILDLEDPVFEFNKAIIDATHDQVCCYKPNIAFYEGIGLDALKSLKKTTDYIHSLGGLALVDAKRGDIGNTEEAYARSLFDDFGFDATTFHPYMGVDTILPLTARKDKGVIVIIRSSNPGGADFQNLEVGGKKLYEVVAETFLKNNENENIGFVVGATVPAEMKKIRDLAPEITFLVPGMGAQGGDLEGTLTNGLRADGLGLIINSSRGIIYASNGEDFAEAARAETIKLKEEINKYR